MQLLYHINRNSHVHSNLTIKKDRPRVIVDSTPNFESRGLGFESRHGHQIKTKKDFF